MPPRGSPLEGAASPGAAGAHADRDPEQSPRAARSPGSCPMDKEQEILFLTQWS